MPERKSSKRKSSAKILWSGLLLLILMVSLIGCSTAQQPTPETPPQQAVEDPPASESEKEPDPQTQPPLPEAPKDTPSSEVEVSADSERDDIPQPESSPIPEENAPPETEPPQVPEEILETENPPEQEELPPPDEAPEEAILPESEKSPLPVLMYHHVVPDGSSCNDMTVTSGKLRADFEYILAHGYTPVLPRELASGSPLPDKPVLITFDDGYTSNYTLLFPLLKELGLKAVISAIVCMPDIPTTNFCSWEMYREMSDSGLVEIASHTYRLHNLDGRSGNFTPGGINGIQRQSDESDEDFQVRVLDDIQKSYDRLKEELGISPTCFAYPFGVMEPDAGMLIGQLFPVTLKTTPATADLNLGLTQLPRWTVTMKTDLSTLLP